MARPYLQLLSEIWLWSSELQVFTSKAAWLLLLWDSDLFVIKPEAPPPPPPTVRAYLSRQISALLEHL